MPLEKRTRKLVRVEECVGWPLNLPRGSGLPTSKLFLTGDHASRTTWMAGEISNKIVGEGAVGFDLLFPFGTNSHYQRSFFLKLIGGKIIASQELAEVDEDLAKDVSELKGKELWILLDRAGNLQEMCLN